MVAFENVSSPVARIVCLTPRMHEIRSENRGMPVGTSGLGSSRGGMPVSVLLCASLSLGNCIVFRGILKQSQKLMEYPVGRSCR